MDGSPPGSSVHGDSPGKNAGVGCHCNDICHMIYFSDVISLGCSDKESACHAGDPSLIPGLGRSPGGGHGNPLQYSCLENPKGQKSLVGYNPWGCKELDIIEQLRTQLSSKHTAQLQPSKVNLLTTSTFNSHGHLHKPE